MAMHCTRCGAYARPADKFCGACGAGLQADAPPPLEAGSAPNPGPFGIDVNLLTRILQVVSIGFVLVLAGYHLVTQATALSPRWVIAASLAAFIALVTTVMRDGLRQMQHHALHLAMYLAGGLALETIAEAMAEGDVMPWWRLWLIYTGAYALIFIALPRVIAWFRGPLLDPARFETIANEAHEAQLRREGELLRLPSHSWYLLATWVTAATMFGSFVTTAIGLYDEVVDPHDHWIIKFGVPIGLSALASLIIWAGWNFVFLRMRVASTTFTRTLAYTAGLVIIVPLTLAISTVFGIIGVGGSAGLKAHHTWYIDVLDAYYQRAEQIRQAELRLENVVETLRGQYRRGAEAESSIGTTCGAGQGNLYQYYREQGSQAENLLEQINKRREVRSEIPAEIKVLRTSIDNPSTTFREAQGGIAEQFKALRPKIQNLEVGSLQSSIGIFVGNLANLAESDEYFRLWGQCQFANRGRIQADLKNALNAVRKDFDDTREDIERLKSTAVQRFLAERQSSTIPFLDAFILIITGRAGQGEAGSGSEDIPSFVPMRPFWAVMNYAGQLPGYIALQLALDFSPAFLGLLFALLAPFPSHTGWGEQTRLGRWLDRKVGRGTGIVEGRQGGADASEASPSMTDDAPPPPQKDQTQPPPATEERTHPLPLAADRPQAAPPPADQAQPGPKP